MNVSGFLEILRNSRFTVRFRSDFKNVSNAGDEVINKLPCGSLNSYGVEYCFSRSPKPSSKTFLQVLSNSLYLYSFFFFFFFLSFSDENNLLFMESSAVDAMYVAAAFQYLCNG